MVEHPTVPAKNPAPALRRKIFLAAGIAAAVLLYWGTSRLMFGGGTKGSASDELTTEVRRGPLTISFNERGTIKASKSDEVYSKLEGMSTIVSVVPEGTFVKKGDLLVELDSSELTQLQNQQTITVDTAKAAFDAATEQVEITRSQNLSDLETARLNVTLAEIDKEKYEKGDYLLAEAKASADIFIAEEELKRAETKYKWTKKLAEKGYVTGTELLADDLAVKKADVQLKQAQRSQNVLKEYTRRKDKEKVESDLRQAQRALERMELKTKSLLAQAMADLKAKESTYNLSLRRLNKIKDQVEKTRIYAPQDGMVVYHQEGHWGREDRMIEQGGTVRENQHLINLPDLSIMAVAVQIPEARIHQIKPGLTATITIDSQQDLALRGTVTKIGLLPDYVNRWLNPDLKVYNTDITIEPGQDTSLLRPGMLAKVDILVAELEDATYVPIQSVTTIDGQTVCFMKKGNDFERRNVTVGLMNNTHAQILQGLESGEVIKLNAPPPTGTPPSLRKEREAGPPDEEIANGEGRPVPASFKDMEGGPPGGKRRGPPRPGTDLDGGQAAGPGGEKGEGPGGRGDDRKRSSRGKKGPLSLEGEKDGAETTQVGAAEAGGSKVEPAGKTEAPEKEKASTSGGSTSVPTGGPASSPVNVR